MDFFILLGGILLIGVFLLVLMPRRRRFSPRDEVFVREHWEATISKVANEPKQALIEADKILDFVLKKKGYSGSLGEKLKEAGPLFSRVDDVWEAHKLRNRVAHELGFNISQERARAALAQIKRGIEDVGVRF